MKYVYLSLLGVAISGCANNDLSLTITKFVAITTMGNCVIDPTSTVTQTGGLLDVGIVKAGQTVGIKGYIAAPVVSNNIPERIGAGQVELDAITVDAFDIFLDVDPAVAGAVPLGDRVYEIPSAVGTIPPGGSTMFGADAEILPEKIALELAGAVQPGATYQPTMIAHVRPLGWHGGSRVAGRYFAFPIQICNLCLTTNPIPACPMLPLMTSQVTKGGCFPQEDDAVTCCTQNGQLLCGSELTPKM